MATSKSVATDIISDDNERSFSLITIEYDLETKDAKVVSVEPFADSKHVAIYKAQKLLAKKMFGIE